MQISYEDFYNLVWNYYITYSDVSKKYREKNQDFLRTLTFSLYREYQKHNVHEAVYAKNLKLFFNNLFLYSADSFDDGEVVDFNRE